ncbi:hypothetical protein CFC21_063618 [Triticum aestivum]|uniref:Late embryogenesis abundant protein LEA-2 subgroup domain-containing protein n=3 Tax=Triticum TaxID=4564 RepID=A0A341UD52_WHEAT|nr:hypothetical protein CFC21_059582 [Triticum aestivum]KAF7056186.1 hypothetical protein CFC21_063618 [Triticum aestivum]VAI11130.1 unnamed protein product [Triticum turgidum subsp. durum]
MRGAAAARRDGERRSFRWAILAVVMLLLAVGALYGAVMYKTQLRLQVCDAKLMGGPVVYDPLTLNTTLQGLSINVTLCWK